MLGGFGLGSTLSIGALLAEKLSGSAAWSGSAATFSTLGSAVLAVPLANLAYRAGRRRALAAGAGLAISGALLVILSAALGFFPLELVALFLLGAGSAASLQARFAAADIPVGRKTGRDLSLVVWATTVGAVIGPNLFGPGEWVGHLLGLPELTGPFVFTVLAQTLSTTVFWFGLRPDPLLVAKEISALPARRVNPKTKQALDVIRRYPIAGLAILSIALSHMVMVAIMSMTPVHLHGSGHGLAEVGFTISLHIAGMYAFSPVFGWLADKIGSRAVIGIGVSILIGAVLWAGLGAAEYSSVIVGLFLLGLGWSANTVAGSALLASALPIEAKTQVQGFSDSLMSYSGAFGGAVAGSLLTLFGFTGLNFFTLIPVAIVITVALISRRWT
jgi:MFS family permease